MTDLEKLKEMFGKAKIDFRESKGKSEHTVLTVERGYAGFCSSFTFNEKGELLDLEAYE